MRSRVNLFCTFGALALAAVVAGCAVRAERSISPATPDTAARSAVNGPAADYPMVLGDPFTIDGITYTPSDALNVDEVGYATLDDLPGASGVTAAHRTLPLPSYIEVTALDSGRTALVRVERRGPMTNARLVALSPGAMAQLGIGEGAPVRLRRVNPPEDDRAELRAGREAALRMDTPQGLLDVLKRKLPAAGSLSLHDPRQAQVSGTAPTRQAIAAIEPDGAATAPPVPPATAASPTPAPAASPAPAPETTGNFVVQVGAFSIRANADRLAGKIGGFVDTSGRLARVLAGPFASRGQAQQALAKLRAEGYSDALITTQR